MIKIKNNDSKDKPTLVSDNDRGLEVVRVSKSYNNRPVIREVSFNIRKGEAVGLLGPNGSGKTTLFYSIIGLIRPNTGNIILNGSDITDLPIYKRSKNGIGYLPQEASIFRGLSVEDNIKSILEIVENDEQIIESNLDEASKIFTRLTKPNLLPRSSPALRYCARWWLVKAKISKNVDKSSLKESITRYRQSGCHNAAKELESKLHSML